VRTVYINRLRWIILCVAVLPVLAHAAWFNASWNYRVPLNIPAGASVNSTIKVDVDFAALLTVLGVAGTFDVNSPRVTRADGTTLSTIQEFTDVVYAGATDAANNGRGEVRFLLEDAGATTYYLYFDIVANGPKAANPQTPINGNFERGATGTQSPSGWTATKANAGFDAQVRPSETPTITTNGGSPSSIVTDGTPNTGAFSYLLGGRTNNEPVNAAPSVTLTRTIAVPASNPGNLLIRYRPEGWDSSDNGATQWDFVRMRLIGGTTTEIVGPTIGNYATYPFSPNKGTGAATNNQSGYGQYNGWDTDLTGTHRAGMTIASGSQPWFTRSYSLSGYVGQTITLQITANNSTQFNSWTHIDDVEWSVVSATLGAPESQPVLPGGFNAYEASTAAGAISGVIKTKIAGASFNLDLIALNTAKTAIETRFTGAVKVELLNASNNSAAVDANGCRSSWTTIQTLGINPVFAAANNGRLTTAFSENNSWPEVRVRITYPATGTATAIGCSTDNFAIRPNSFANINVTDSDWVTSGTTRTLNNISASGGVVHKAGQPLRLAAVAVNALGNTTTNYIGAPSATPVSCMLPTGCTNANLGTFTVGASAVAGVLTAASASYSEVGAFTLQLVDTSFANVDAADSSTAERYISSTAINVGRFVPDHFDLTANGAPQFKTFNDPTCVPRSFTYVGQPFGYVTLPQSLVLARNAAGNTTVNYSGNLWKLTAANATQTYSPITPATPALDVTGIGTPLVASSGNGTGSVTSNSADSVFYIRTTPVAPFNANITLTVSVQDTAENAASQGIITTTLPVLYNGSGSGIAFDAGNEIRYGRMRLNNAIGSELLPLTVPLTTQYWTGVGWVTNSSDSCTQAPIPTSVSGLTFYLQTPTNQLASSDVIARMKNAAGTEIISGNGVFSSGGGRLRFTFPTNTNAGPGAGHFGYVDVSVTSPTWLQYNWTGIVGNPRARATFGAYSDSKKFIYQRENY
jgi:hypothetical protein